MTTPASPKKLVHQHSRGGELVIERLRDLPHRGGWLRLLTGDYVGLTEPTALNDLLLLEKIDLRVFETQRSGFIRSATSCTGEDPASPVSEAPTCPYGWVDVEIEGKWFQAKLVKVAVNLVKDPESGEKCPSSDSEEVVR